MQFNELYFINAVRVVGLGVQKGVAILRPHQLVFAPTEGMVNVAGAVAAGTIGALAGYAVRTVPASFPSVHAFVQHIAMFAPPDFGAHLEHATTASGWLRLLPASTRVVRKKFLFRGDRLFLWFEQGNESVRFDGPVEKGREDHVRQLLSGWTVS